MSEQILLTCSNPDCRKGIKANISDMRAGRRLLCSHCRYSQELQESPELGWTLVLCNLGWLAVHDEDVETQIFPIFPGKTLIGRNAETTPSDVAIRIKTDDMHMSRRHCKIETVQTGNGNIYFILSDAGSRNPPYLNEELLHRLDEVYLEDNSLIQLGVTKVRFYSIDSYQSQKALETALSRQDFGNTIHF